MNMGGVPAGSGPGVLRAWRDRLRRLMGRPVNEHELPGSEITKREEDAAIEHERAKRLADRSEDAEEPRD